MSRNCSARSAHLNPTYSTFYNHDFCPILMQNYSFFGLLFFLEKIGILLKKMPQNKHSYVKLKFTEDEISVRRYCINLHMYLLKM